MSGATLNSLNKNKLLWQGKTMGLMAQTISKSAFEPFLPSADFVDAAPIADIEAEVEKGQRIIGPADGGTTFQTR